MSLTQATNIMPSRTGAGGAGNGVIDANNPLVISWQVNGSSAMVAYRVVIYKNDAASTQVFTTGKVTLGTPFYGKDALGNFVLFSFTIPVSSLTTAGIVNGGNFKFVITQWWGNTDAESITQSSASVFITRGTPTLSINSIPSPITGNRHTFTATYTQNQNDPVDWVRWKIAEIGRKDSPVYDSGEIYTSVLSCTFDRFISSEISGTENYSIQCTVQTVNGVEVSTGWVDFSVYYAISPLSGFVTASCLKRLGAVKVSWPRIVSIEGDAVGPYTINGGMINLPAGSSVTWDDVSGDAMSFAAPWTIVLSGMVQGEDATLLEIDGDNKIYLNYYSDSKTISVSVDSTQILNIENVEIDANYTIILTPTNVFWRLSYYVGALYPKDSLYPNSVLYPTLGTYTTFRGERSISYTQNSVTGISIFGPQICKYVELQMGELESNVIEEMLSSDDYVPVFNENTYMMADFSIDLEAGPAKTVGSGISGYSIYRQRENGGALLHVMDTENTVTSFYDYTIRNQQGPYKWFVYVKDQSSYMIGPIESNEVNPCFWDWVLLSCEKTEHGYYLVNKAFRFGKNLFSGQINNGNDPGIYENFTPYPTVMSTPQNYKSGSLSSLIGIIEMNESGNIVYSDTLQMRDAIFNLSVTNDHLFLRNRKGDLMEIKVNGAIAMETNDASFQQAQTMQLPWCEVADASDVSLVSFVEQ